MTDYEIFKACFEQLNIDEETFTRLAFPKGAYALSVDGAFAVYQGENITLLCVAPQYRGKGIGSRLLGQCEYCIGLNGGAKAVLGGGLLSGAVSGSYAFFEKRGYRFNGEFNEMELLLSDIKAPEADIPDTAELRFFDGDIAELRRAVAQVDEEWVQYFTNDETVLCCYMGGELASFCIVGEDERCLLCDGAAKVGSIGCVGTLPKFRRKGLGLNMVALAAEHLRKRGCDKAFIHWTHLDKWYNKLGAQVLLKFAPAHKVLP